MYEIHEIRHLSSNESGSTYAMASIKSEGYLLASRKAGSISGNHWHTGKSAAKNPESLLLISGSVRLNFQHIETGEKAEIIVEAPRLIKIYPQVLHTLEAQTDIIFFEFNSLEEHKADTQYPAKD